MVYLKRDRDELRPIIWPTPGSGRQPGISKTLVSWYNFCPPSAVHKCLILTNLFSSSLSSQFLSAMKGQMAFEAGQ